MDCKATEKGQLTSMSLNRSTFVETTFGMAECVIQNIIGVNFVARFPSRDPLPRASDSATWIKKGYGNMCC